MSIKTVEGFMSYPESNSINIVHNLSSYPLIQVVYLDSNSYGVLPYGYQGFGESIADNMQVRYEYVSDMEVKINFSFKYKNLINLTMVNSNKYAIDFDNNLSAIIYLK